GHGDPAACGETSLVGADQRIGLDPRQAPLVDVEGMLRVDLITVDEAFEPHLLAPSREADDCRLMPVRRAALAGPSAIAHRPRGTECTTLRRPCAVAPRPARRRGSAPSAVYRRAGRLGRRDLNAGRGRNWCRSISCPKKEPTPISHTSKEV